MKFKIPFLNQGTYSKALITELSNNLSNYNQEVKDKVKWRPVKSILSANSSTYAIQNWENFARSLSDLTGKLTVLIAPEQIEDYKGFNNWLATAIESPISDILRLMIIDFKGGPMFKSLYNLPTVQVIDANLDMRHAMKEVAIAAGGANPGTQFQCHFIDLSKAASKKDMKKVEQFANKALEIAVAQQWFHLQIAVHTTVGTAYLNNKENDQAIHAFQSAENIARKAMERKEDNANKLLANTLFSIGAAYIGKKQFNKSTECYQQIPEFLEEKEDAYLLMEAWRMTAYSYRQRRNNTDAINCYTKAYNIGKRLDPKQRPNSTLPFIGKQLIRLYDKKFDAQKSESIERQMVELLGKDWKNLHTPKQVKN